MKITTYPQTCADFLHLLTELMVAPFTIPTSGIYQPPQPDSPLSFFPNLPQLHRDALYAADVVNQASTDSDSCRKNAYGHPTLSPGVFTIFCMHGICYGFEILKSHKSPKHPFSIFNTQLQRSSMTTAASCMPTASTGNQYFFSEHPVLLPVIVATSVVAVLQTPHGRDNNYIPL